MSDMRIVILITLAAMLSACGNKGALYLPSKPPADSSQETQRK